MATMARRMKTVSISCLYPLLLSLILDIVWGLDGHVQDYCFPDDIFNATCSSVTGQVILMQSARYGRMKKGRCLPTDQDIGCGADVLAEVGRMCSGRHHCQIAIPDKTLHKLQPCTPHLRAYLEAAYKCLPVQTGDATGCSSNGGIVLTQQSGYLASIVASERHRGTQRCPWVLRVSPGQRVNITLLDFSAVSRPYETEPIGCRLYAKIHESGVHSDVSICGGREKERAVYMSKGGSRVEIRIMHFNTAKETAHFILKYDVIGCVDPDIPLGSTMSRSVDKAVVTCNDTKERWHIVCHETKWIGTLGSCVVAEDLKQMSGAVFPFDLLVAVVAGVLLGAFLGFLFLAAVVLCHRRQTRLSRARLTREPQYAPCSQHGQRPVYVEAVLGDTEDISFEIIGRGNRKSSSDKYGVAIPVTAHARYPGQYPATELVVLSRDNNSYERPNFTRIDACESSLCKTAAIPCYYEAGRAIPDIVADNVVESGV